MKTEINKNCATDQRLNCPRIIPEQSKLRSFKWWLLCLHFHQTDNGDSRTNLRIW